MSERSARQRKFIQDARAIAMRMFQSALENPNSDNEDVSTLYELEYCVQVANGMLLSGHFGECGNVDIRQFVEEAKKLKEDAENHSAEVENLRDQVNRLQNRIHELERALGGKH
jgi:phage shock protein A